MAQSVSARNALGRSEKNDAREIATMLYGEVHSSGQFRFVNFGHPPPLVFSGENQRFTHVTESRMAQFLPLGLQIPEDYPDRNRYFSLEFRQRRANSTDVAEITLMAPGDVLFLYTDEVHNGRDDKERQLLKAITASCQQKTSVMTCWNTRSLRRPGLD